MNADAAAIEAQTKKDRIADALRINHVVDGMSREEVIRAWGDPIRVDQVDGHKEIWYYKLTLYVWVY